MSKPLINRLLLENSNKQVQRTPKTLEEELVPDWNINSSFVYWEIPNGSKELREQACQITRLRDTDSATYRILFRKVIKGLDKKDFRIIQYKFRIK